MPLTSLKCAGMARRWSGKQKHFQDALSPLLLLWPITLICNADADNLDPNMDQLSPLCKACFFPHTREEGRVLPEERKERKIHSESGRCLPAVRNIQLPRSVFTMLIGAFWTFVWQEMVSKHFQAYSWPVMVPCKTANTYVVTEDQLSWPQNIFGMHFKYFLKPRIW